MRVTTLAAYYNLNSVIRQSLVALFSKIHRDLLIYPLGNIGWYKNHDIGDLFGCACVVRTLERTWGSLCAFFPGES